MKSLHRPTRRRAGDSMYSDALALAFAGGLMIASGDAAAASRLRLPRADGAAVAVMDHRPPQPGCVATLIISPGFGGDETGHSALARGVAESGWRVLVIGHRESGPMQLREALDSPRPILALAEASAAETAHAARRLDLDAVTAEARRLCSPTRLVLAGHSMGARTILVEAGATTSAGSQGRNRFDAYIAISPQGAGSVFADDAWASISRPVLVVTGTRDRGLQGSYESRLGVFRGLPPGRKRLAVIAEADHLQLAGRGSKRVDALLLSLVREFLTHTNGQGWLAGRVSGVTIEDK